MSIQCNVVSRIKLWNTYSRRSVFESSIDIAEIVLFYYTIHNATSQCFTEENSPMDVVISNWYCDYFR